MNKNNPAPAEEEARRAYWSEPIYTCLDCGERTTGERDRCAKCETESPLFRLAKQVSAKMEEDYRKNNGIAEE